MAVEIVDRRERFPSAGLAGGTGGLEAEIGDGGVGSGEGLDEGDILLTRSTPIPDAMTGAELREVLALGSRVAVAIDGQRAVVVDPSAPAAVAAVPARFALRAACTFLVFAMPAREHPRQSGRSGRSG